MVAASGALLAFAANSISARGLKLATDYFPGSPVANSGASPVNASSAGGAVGGVPSTVAERVEREGFHLVTGPEAIRVFQDPGYQQETIAFIDARDDDAYQAGHVPGAYQLDRYHAEKYLPTAYPVCQQAQQLVIYCHGGDCEDSLFTAKLLRDAGIPKEKISIFVGGWSEWSTNGQPVELASRKSGELRPPAK